MSQITISEQAASALAFEAQTRGCTEEELASMLIEDGLRVDEHYQPTPEQQARLLESYAQARRGELVDGEIVMERLRKTIAEIESR